MKVIKKRLLIIAPAENAYSETFIQNQIKFLEFEKFILYGQSYEEFKIGGEYIYPKFKLIKYVRKLIEKFGIRTSDWPMRYFKSCITSLKIDVALIEYGSLGALVINPLHELNIPTVVHFHGADASYKPSLEELYDEYQNMFLKSSKLIAVSKNMIERLVELGAPREKILYNCYGVDITKFKQVNEKHDKYILSVGRFVEKKAPHLTILAFVKVFQQRSFLKLKMVGIGPLLNACKQLVKALDAENAVEFLGVQGADEVAILMSNSICYIQHSVISELGDAEGTPLAILEAGASGIPVISTKHEGIKDVIIEGRNGFLVDEFDVDEMTRKILTVVDDDCLAKKLGEEARRIVCDEYNLESHISNLNQILNNASGASTL